MAGVETDMEKRLRFILERTNDWLKFAEAKNAALLVAIAAVSKPIIDHFPTSANSIFVRVPSTTGVALASMAAATCLFSFLPLLKFRWLFPDKAKGSTDNLFYFGHAAHYSAFDFLDALYDADGIPNAKRKVEIDLAGQVVTNSRIALRKYCCFQIAAWLTLSAFLFLGITAMLYLTIN